MHVKTSEKIVQGVFTKLDNEIWDKVAEKAVLKMPKYKLVNESSKMFSDFTILNSQQNLQSAGEMIEQKQKTKTFKQTLIVGVHKVVSAQNKIHNKPTHSIINEVHNHQTHDHHNNRNKKRLASAIQLNNNKKTETSKNTFFRLTTTDFPNEQQSKVDENLRVEKYDNIRYNQFMQETQRQRRTQSQYRSLIEKKRLKQMKIFTYDYEGKLISQANQKAKNAGIHILAMKPQFGNFLKTNRTSNQKITKNEKILQIINKKVVNQPPPTQPIKQTQKQIEQKQKLAKIIKNLQHPPPNKFEYFKQEDKISAGVTITDLNNKSTFMGKITQKSERKYVKLNQFKGQFKQIQPYQEKLKFKKLKLKQGQNSGFRTEYNQQGSNFRRLKTEATEKQSKVYTSATGYSKKRGRIDIKNQKLYTENFIQDLD